jgi:hypothetical protein
MSYPVDTGGPFYLEAKEPELEADVSFSFSDRYRMY